jgi:hypothetical protein
MATIGPTAAVERPDEAAGWGRELAELEAAHAHVLLLALADDGDWADFCLRQADRILVVATGAPVAAVRVPEGCDIALLGAPRARR